MPRRLPLLLVALLLPACATDNIGLENTDVSENGSILILPAPVPEINAFLRSLVDEWKLVVARDKSTDLDGQFDFSTTSSAAIISTSAAGQGSTRAAIYPGTMVTAAGGQTIHAADPRTLMDLQRSIVARLAQKYHVRAMSTSDSTWERIRQGR